MKQIIVLAAFIGLGIFISSVVLGFETDVEKLRTNTEKAITKVADNINVAMIAENEI